MPATGSAIASATSSWRRGCRSSSGARCPTPSWSRSRRAGTLKTTGGARQAGAAHARRSRGPRRWRRGSRSQWLRLQDVEKVRPDGMLYPQWDQSLTESMRKETELFFDSLVREDRSVLDLLNADYTFVNERLARHYGIPNVTGADVPPRARCRRPRRGMLDAGQHPDADLGRRSHLAGAARQVGDAGAARLAAAAAAAERAGARRDEGAPQDGTRAVGARAHGAAPREPGVHVVPPRHRPARPRARELRRHRPVPHQGQRRAGRLDRRALRRHARWKAPTACATRC